MSVEATALSRSKLEQKDRSELAAIVEAMGGNAGSRAKKAELVDLVLELAGASPSAPPSSTSTPSPTEAAPDETAHTNGDPARATAPASFDEEPAAEWETALASEPVDRAKAHARRIKKAFSIRRTPDLSSPRVGRANGRPPLARVHLQPIP